MQLIELTSAILTVMGIDVLLHQVDWVAIAHFIHLR
jgi:hypothetical protein